MNKTRLIGNLGGMLLLILISFLPTGDGAIRLPLAWSGKGLRALSLSGATGNLAAIAIYIAVCLLPLLLLLKGKRHIEDLLLPLTSAAMFYSLYVIINPSQRATVLMGDVGDLALECAVYSVFFAWVMIRLVRYCRTAEQNKMYHVLWVLLGICAVLCVLAGFGGGWDTYRHTVDSVKSGNTAPGLNLTPTYAFAFLRFAADAVEYVLTAWILMLGQELVLDIKHDPYSEAACKTAVVISKWCRVSLTVAMLMMVVLNVGQLLMAESLHHLSAAVHIPLLGITVTLVMMAVSKLLAKGAKLKRENDSFV